MRRPATTFLACLLAALALPAAATAQGASPRIVGGSTASIADNPWQVWVTTTAEEIVCGGSILDSTHVITAAHCVEDEGAMKVGYGSASLNSIVASNDFALVDETALDPRRNANLNDGYDTAVLTLATPIPITAPAVNRAIAPASASLVASVLASGSASGAHVSGWGSTSAAGDAVNFLRATDLPLVADGSCSGYYPGDFVASVMLCAGAAGKDTCYGDSGGPLTVKDPASGDSKLAGLTSFGPIDSCGDVPGVYTEVTEPATLNFIAAALAGTPPDDPGDPDPVDPGTPSTPWWVALLGSGSTAKSSPPVASPDTTRPTAGVRSVACRKRKCTVNVRATDSGGAVARVSLKLTWKAGGRARTKSVKAKQSGGSWVAAVRLSPGSYRLSVTAVDAAGNRQARAATRKFRVR